MRSLAEALEEGPFQGYAYAYPHKTAYRAMPPRRLEEVWSGEPMDALSLYVHIPFCSVRCGFCNLFATSGQESERVTGYLSALERQARRVASALGDARFVRLAIGGGTPTFLSAGELERLVGILRDTVRVDPAAVPSAVEVSPETATADRLRVLREAGFRRVSIGVQTFDEASARAIGRPQRPRDAASALDRLREAGFRALNIDLIYGAPGQPGDDLARSLDTALRWRPEELYLYPLYIRPLTALGKRSEISEATLETYRSGRALLLAEGYEQVSMRMFRRAGVPSSSEPDDYRCQDDGMVGLGAGARSYTHALHYAGEFAVARASVRDLIDRFVAQGEEDMGLVRHGFELDTDEQARRWLIQSLLQGEGLDRARYTTRFGRDVLDAWPALAELEPAELASIGRDQIRLTSAGLELSDALGPWLYSEAVRRRMREATLS